MQTIEWLFFKDGIEAIIANRADGLGVERLPILGVSQLILSTETNSVVKARAAKLGFEVIESGKKFALRNF